MKTKGLRRVFRWIVGSVLLVVIACILCVVFCSKDEKQLPKPEACAVVSNVIEVIERVFAADGDFIRLDVRKMTCADFEKQLSGVSDAATLWTPGEGDWLIIGAKNGCSNTMERVMDAFSVQETAYSLPEVFANYVGTIAEIRPAFQVVNPADGVVPELFVSKDIPDIEWMKKGEVDVDISSKTRQAIRSMQVVRRVVLEGDMLSRQQKEDEAITKWTNANRRAPNDTLLLERMDHLLRNAEVFYKVGKYGMASKCYETILRIRPDDYVAAVNLGECLKRLGKKELSEAVFKRAETLRPKEQLPPKL